MDISNGPGIRVSIFVSGCTLHCKGCFNYELWDFDNGIEYTEETADEIIKLLDKSHIQGLSILGGEPLDNIDGVIDLVKRVRKEFGYSKDIWLYTGYNYESFDYDSKELFLISMCDVLVDGPFKEELKDSKLLFRGSSNQRLIDIHKSMLENKIINYENNF